MRDHRQHLRRRASPLLTGSTFDGGRRITTKSSSNCVATYFPIGLNQSARGTSLNSCQHFEVELLTPAFVKYWRARLFLKQHIQIRHARPNAANNSATVQSMSNARKAMPTLAQQKLIVNWPLHKRMNRRKTRFGFTSHYMSLVVY